MELDFIGFSQEDIKDLQASIEKKKACDKVGSRSIFRDSADAEVIIFGLELCGEIYIAVLAAIIVEILKKIAETKPESEPKVIINNSITIVRGDTVESIQTKLNRIKSNNSPGDT